MIREIKIIGISLILVIASCNKWKEPTDVDFYVDINTANSVNNQLSFTNGEIILEYFDFDASRDKGDDVIFDQDYPSGLIIPFNPNQVVSELEFMIPQGEYKRVDIGFRTFDDNGDNCILIEGIYSYSGGGTIPMRFEFTDSEVFKVRAENANGGDIILDKDILSPAKIELDPAHWFQPVPISFFESADITDIDGTNTILINKNTNDAIYDIVLDRLDESVLITFNY
jgi:hypothetical protein